MQARFLLGSAGSGKTFRCLAEIRAELNRDPAGLPLILLAPKQATFQLERQLLADPSLAGYTRLQIVSFDRLAEFTLGEFAAVPPRLLDAEGRVMVLRSLLTQHQSQLKTFHATARLPGFAQQLSRLLREFQHHRLAPAQLTKLAVKFPTQPALAGKLHDLALLFHNYADWLAANNLQDAETLPELAAAAINQAARTAAQPLRVGGLWLDGFAEMTPQELELLAAFLPVCEQATLTFCLPGELAVEPSWLSPWSVVAQTFSRCREQLKKIPALQITIETLPQTNSPTRFSENPTLAHLEQNWPHSTLALNAQHPTPALVLVRCPDPEAEATLAAREILRHVRAGGRYRDTSIILRSLDGYVDTLRRVFARYEIPVHFDRRESIAHHPLAELSRSALRLAAFGWQHDDWFGVLKTGLVTDDDNAVDILENAALEHGWSGEDWFRPLQIPGDASLEISANAWLAKMLPPFTRWRTTLTAHQTGNQLAAALRELWRELSIEATLEKWSAHSALHQTVLDQLDKWLANLELAFAETPLPLREWLPILEAGLSSLTVGVIPPALDQVLVGTVDRSRHPEIKLAFVLGLNEGIFPASVTTPSLLSDTERDALAAEKIFLGPDRHQQISRERFYGYVACTRARERLVLTCAAQNLDGQALNPSPFFTHAQTISDVTVEIFNPTPDWWQAEHATELAAPLLKTQNSKLKTCSFPSLAPLLAKHELVQLAAAQTTLQKPTLEKLFTTALHSSVSRLESFAECPFKFFASSTLRLKERKEFEFDDRDKGSFHHAVLEAFHHRVKAAHGEWRNLPVADGVALVETIAREQLPQYERGKFLADGAARFTGEVLITRLKLLIAALYAWLPQYDFNPTAAELAFNGDPGQLPAWQFALPKGHTLILRGRIDRVDLFQTDAQTALAVVLDYKSSPRKLDATRLHNGLELQLLSYLGVLQNLTSPEEIFTVKKIIPAGVFFIPLNGGNQPKSSRAQIAYRNQTDLAAYQHSGRFLADELAHFDNRGQTSGDQFKYSILKGGELGKRSNEALPQAEFTALTEKVTGHLRDYATRIFAGELAVSPYRLGNKTACDYCDFRPVCRFDLWTQPFRQLRPPPKPPKAVAAKKPKDKTQ